MAAAELGLPWPSLYLTLEVKRGIGTFLTTDQQEDRPMLQAVKDRCRRWRLTRRLTRPQLKLNTLTAGARSGVWTLCPDFLNRDSVVYSFGVGDNIAWDLAMIERFGLTVQAFDPTPATVDWIGKQNLPDSFRFNPVGLAGHDGTQELALPQRGSRFNFRPTAYVQAGEPHVVSVPVARLTTLMSRLGHTFLDVLKIDIEGGEYAALDDFVAHPVPVKQLLIEFHHHFRGIGIQRTENAVRLLQAVGYEIFHISGRGLELSFVRQP